MENDAGNTGPTATAAESTWVKRQPTTLIQPIRLRQYRQKTHAEHQTEKMRHERAKENNEALQAEVKAFHNLRAKMVKELAARFKKKEEYIRVLLCSSSTLKTTRKPNLKNAIIHKKVKELNEGREEGNRLSLLEVQKMINVEEIMRELTEEEKTDILQQLEDHRELKHKGARATSISAAQDMRCTMQRLTQEADNLASRTGAHVFLFTTRGHVDDRGIPGWTATENTEAFFSDVLKIEAWNLLRKFEQWACANDRSGLAGQKDSWQGLRTQCSNYILGGLKYIANMDHISMNYVNYEKSIIQKYRLKLVGWPDDVKFTNPASLTSVDDLRKLRHALRTQTCHWVKLSDRELRQHTESIKQREVSGECVGRKRKARSDKGKSRKRVARERPDNDLDDGDDDDGDGDYGGDDNDNDNDQSPGPSSAPVPTRMKTRSKGGRRGRPFKSKEIIHSSDDDDGDGDDYTGDDNDNDQSPGPSSATAPARTQTHSKAGRIRRARR
ncbi:hypothetical protein F5887DRAFT_898053 [Amanita rubescens]|nr:hypothetical protein F5887DRAFT_898053 [Amanita rubescens]